VSIDVAVATPNPEEARLVQAHLRLVRQIAAEIHKIAPAADFDDLVSHGQEGLLKGVRSFDPERGLELAQWAAWLIRHSIYDHLRSLSSMSRTVARKLRALEAASDASVSFQANASLAPGAGPDEGKLHLARQTDAMVKAAVAAVMAMEDADAAASPEAAYLHAEMKASMKKAIAMLDERLRRFIDAYFFREQTLKAAGAELGVSEPTAWRLLLASKEAIVKALKEIGFLT
jgi:RNA polymerase sigma factor (sigma-70 family)